MTIIDASAQQQAAGNPGSYRLLDRACLEDPYPFYRALLDSAPVYRVPDTQVYLVCSHALVHEVLADRDSYSANLTGILITSDNGEPELFDLSQFGGTGDALANADDPVHPVHRKLVLPQLNSRRVAALEDEVRHWARTRVEALVAAGGGECITALANEIPVMVMARLAGLPVEDTQRLLHWAFAGGEILAGTGNLARMAELSTSTSELSAYLLHALQEAARDIDGPAQDVIGELVRGIDRAEVSEQEALSILIVLVGAAGESTSSLVGSAIRLLAQDTAMQGRLRDDPTLIEAFVEEVVRLESPFRGHYRVVLKDVLLGGVDVPAGARLFLLWGAANRDPSVFADPDTLSLERQDSGEHLGFGYGMHFCIGARLARLEARVVLEELLVRTRVFEQDTATTPRHAPSLLVRRLEQLELSITPA